MALVAGLDCLGLPGVYGAVRSWLRGWSERTLLPLEVSMLEFDILVEPPESEPEPPESEPEPPESEPLSAPRGLCFQRNPVSPCFVGDLQSVDRGERAVSALLKCQRVLVQNYVILGDRGVFCTSIREEPVLLQGDDVRGHPVQDPMGALTAALLVLRRNRPGEGCWMDPPHDMNLSQDVRRTLAAILCVCQKMAVSQSSIGYRRYANYVLKLFLLPHELPRWRNDWAAEYKLIDEAEMAVLYSEPLLSITTGNPLVEAEVFIEELVSLKGIDKHNGHVLRGCCFFLVGSCLMNPENDVFEQLATHMNMPTIGQGIVSLLLMLHQLANADPGRAILYKVPHDSAVEQVAQIMLCNATNGHANQLRIGPYRAQTHFHETPHIVQKMMSPTNLALAKATFQQESQQGSLSVARGSLFNN